MGGRERLEVGDVGGWRAVGTNVCDAEETPAALAGDLRAGLLRERGEPIDALLAERNLNCVTVEAGARSTGTRSSATAPRGERGSSSPRVTSC